MPGAPGGPPISIDASQFVAPPSGSLQPASKLQPQPEPASMERLRQTIDSLELQVTALRQMLTRAPSRDGSSPVSAFQRGRDLAARRLHRAAIDAFSDALLIDPGNDSAFLLRGEAYQQLGDLANAEADFTDSLKLQPHNSRAYLGRATVRNSLGKVVEAFSDIHEAVTRDPKNPQVYLVRARLFEVSGDFNGAIASYTAALDLTRTDTALLGRATSYLRAGQFALASNDCESARTLNPNAALAHLCLAEIHLRQNSVDRAVASLSSAMLAAQMSGQPLPVLPQLPAILAQAAAPVQPVPVQPAPAPVVAAAPVPVVPAAPAVVPPTVPVAPAPVTPAPTPAKPVVVAAVATPVPAKPAAPKLKPSEIDRQARALTDQGRYEDAIALLTQAITQSPKFAKAFNARGYAHLLMTNYSAAIADFTEAIRLNPAYANAFHNRSVALRKLRNTQAAEEDEKNASRLMAVAYSPIQ